MSLETRTVLVTGFEPFGNRSENASELAVRALTDLKLAQHQVVTKILPVRFEAASDALASFCDELAPELVICVGEAAGRESISVERIAINIDDAGIADNGGDRPIDRIISKTGPAAYWSTLPIKAIVAAIRAGGIEAEVSESAGTFVCNHVFYGLMHSLRGRPSTRGGFIHVPLHRGAAHPETPTMPVDRVVSALKIAVLASLQPDPRH